MVDENGGIYLQTLYVKIIGKISNKKFKEKTCITEILKVKLPN